MDPKSWGLYALPLSVCSVVLDFPPLLLGSATTALILKLLWRSCLSLFFRTHKPCQSTNPTHAVLCLGTDACLGLPLAKGIDGLPCEVHDPIRAVDLFPPGATLLGLPGNIRQGAGHLPARGFGVTREHDHGVPTLFQLAAESTADQACRTGHNHAFRVFHRTPILSWSTAGTYGMMNTAVFRTGRGTVTSFLGSGPVLPPISYFISMLLSQISW